MTKTGNVGGGKKHRKNIRCKISADTTSHAHVFENTMASARGSQNSTVRIFSHKYKCFTPNNITEANCGVERGYRKNSCGKKR